MTLSGLRLWTRSRCSRRIQLLHFAYPNARDSAAPRLTTLSRRHASNVNMDFGNTNSSLLKESPRGNASRNSEPKHDHAGPFQLGLSAAALRKGEKVPKWSELSTGGKVMRTTARTTNLGVILLGAGLSALLLYSLTSELFSKNSPTVLYGDACERIKRSEKLAKYLNGPLTFHNNPPSSIRPRHRNRHVTSRVMVDQNGQEHMIMTFYVQGKPEGSSASSSLDDDPSYFASATHWVQDKTEALVDSSFDDVVDWSKTTGKAAWNRTVRAFKYLSGDPLPQPMMAPAELDEEAEAVRRRLKEKEERERSRWSFAGMFGALKSAKGGAGAQEGRQVVGRDGRKFLEGEVHADLVKNKDGYFVFRYLLVDIPNSRDSHPIRVFVEREPGVRESEPVVRWISS